MSVVVEKERIVLAGHAGVEEAELLLAALLDHAGLPVDVTELTRAHLAVVQVLHAAGRTLVGAPSDPFLGTMVLGGLVSERLRQINSGAA